jgi:hypothetical protein
LVTFFDSHRVALVLKINELRRRRERPGDDPHRRRGLQEQFASTAESIRPRAKFLANHSDAAVREFAVETLKEIETFRISEDSYGYVFHVLQRKT